MIMVYDYWPIGSSSIVYIFHKAISSQVLYGLEVQMNVYIILFLAKVNL